MEDISITRDEQLKLLDPILNHGLLVLGAALTGDQWVTVVDHIVRAFLAGKRLGATALDEIYTWLVEVIHFPFDLNVASKPEWLDVQKLATKWWEFEGQQDTVDEYVWTIYAETGWVYEE